MPDLVRDITKKKSTKREFLCFYTKFRGVGLVLSLILLLSPPLPRYFLPAWLHARLQNVKFVLKPRKTIDK